MLGIDYAARHTRQQLEQMRAQGIRFVIRYLTLPSLSWKRLTRAEADEIRSLGLGLGSVYQVDARYLENFTQAMAARDAETAVQNAQEIGQQRGVIFFAVDHDAPASSRGQINSYLQTIAAKISGAGYEARLYGSFGTVDNASPGIDGHWQTYAWSRGQVSARAALVQCHNGANLVGGSNDVNVAWSDDFLWAKPQETGWPTMPTLRQGGSGWQVSVLQTILIRTGHRIGGIDGTFGAGTDAAVRQYQGDHKLAVDGIVGPHTWEALQRETLIAQQHQPDAVAASTNTAKSIPIYDAGGNHLLTGHIDERGKTQVVLTDVLEALGWRWRYEPNPPGVTILFPAAQQKEPG